MTGDTTINLDNSIKRPSSPKHVEEPLICKKKSDNSLKKPSSLEYVKETPICKKKKKFLQTSCNNSQMQIINLNHIQEITPTFISLPSTLVSLSSSNQT